MIGTCRHKTRPRILQADGGLIKGGTRVVNTSFKFLSDATHTYNNNLLDFSVDTEVLDIGYREMIIGLSWLQEHDFCIDMGRRLIWRKTNDFQVLCRERKIPRIEIIHKNDHFEPHATVIIIDIALRYAAYNKLWSSQQANRLPDHSEFDHSIIFKDPKARLPNRPMYKMTWEDEKVLRAYMTEH